MLSDHAQEQLKTLQPGDSFVSFKPTGREDKASRAPLSPTQFFFHIICLSPVSPVCRLTHLESCSSSVLHARSQRENGQDKMHLPHLPNHHHISERISGLPLLCCARRPIFPSLMTIPALEASYIPSNTLCLILGCRRQVKSRLPVSNSTRPITDLYDNLAFHIAGSDCGIGVILLLSFPASRNALLGTCGKPLWPFPSNDFAVGRKNAMGGVVPIHQWGH